MNAMTKMILMRVMNSTHLLFFRQKKSYVCHVYNVIYTICISTVCLLVNESAFEDGILAMSSHCDISNSHGHITDIEFKQRSCGWCFISGNAGVCDTAVMVFYLTFPQEF